MAQKKTPDEALEELVAEQQAIMAEEAKASVEFKRRKMAVQKKIDKVVARRRLDALLSPEERKLVLGEEN